MKNLKLHPQMESQGKGREWGRFAETHALFRHSCNQIRIRCKSFNHFLPLLTIAYPRLLLLRAK